LLESLQTLKGLQDYIHNNTLEIKSSTEEHLNRFLTEQGWLLTSALIAVVEASRMNPDRYAVIYNSGYDNNDNVLNNNTSTAAAVTYSSCSPYCRDMVFG
jgi:hypothetical protein